MKHPTHINASQAAHRAMRQACVTTWESSAGAVTVAMGKRR